ncbi:uncharacterized protein E0L32_000695 [Thyridium curvatum]|uniref:Uncharacterized protein n=1 Tax=Thyridium curvatum TaxID=1093900 RepID=A0A507B6Q3_9PEZI|nr:uncharacterized protein E0L32_000695 [Thyridium curvatum]TPX12518.1 hypothetical protein E0L32_000695 [Thyridium curvatum]
MTDSNPTAEQPRGSPPAQKSPSGAQAGSPGAPSHTEILPAQHWTNLAESHERDDNADLAVDDKQSSTASISSSIIEYRTIQGRTFHSNRGNAQYWSVSDLDLCGDTSTYHESRGANDERQNEALDIAHHFHTLLFDGKLHLAPLDKDKVQAQTVLDIGTGTGIWAIDFGDQYPNATVIGTDISPIQPTWVPPNVQFQIDDCTQEWTFAPNTADYVHMRWLVGSIVDWTALYKEAFNVLKPGGYLEDHEPSPYIVSDDGTVPDTSAHGQWGKFFVDGGRKIGRSFTIFEDDTQRKAMADAGFVDIVVTDQKARKALPDIGKSS